MSFFGFLGFFAKCCWILYLWGCLHLLVNQPVLLDAFLPYCHHGVTTARLVYGCKYTSGRCPRRLFLLASPSDWTGRHHCDGKSLSRIVCGENLRVTSPVSPVPRAGFTTGVNLGRAGKVMVFDSRASNPPPVYFSHPHNWMMFIPCSQKMLEAKC